MVDKLASVGIEAAVSTRDLAQVLSRCADTAYTAGTSMDRLIGYSAAVSESTQKSMSDISGAFQSIYSRMSSLRSGKLKDNLTGDSLASMKAVLSSLGIQIQDTDDSYRNFGDILDSISERWNILTQAEQNALATAVAKAAQQEIFTALMNNYSAALEYSAFAANSAGSALEQYKLYQDSIEGKANELAAALESLGMHTIDEKLYSGVIQATTNIVKFTDKVGVLKGTLTGLAVMGISKAFVSIASSIFKIYKNLKPLTTAMKLFKGGMSNTNLTAIGQACIGLSEKQLKLVLSTKGLNNSQRESILACMGMEKQQQQQTLATLGFAEAENAAATANRQEQEEARRKAAASAEAHKELQSSFDSTISKYKELKNSIDSGNLSIDDANSAKQQLLEIQDSLIESYGNEANGLDLVNGKYEQQLNLLDKLSKNKAEKHILILNCFANYTNCITSASISFNSSKDNAGI